MKKLHEIISQENIRPSSPTPPDKRTYKLSLFDQKVPPIYSHIVLYYPNLEEHSCNNKNTREHTSQTTLSLKQSLSSTLSKFYPLAGRIKDPLTIDCNDEGILFIVMRHSTSLSDFLKNPDPLTCRDHAPHQPTWTEPEPGSHVGRVQVNFFGCGGIAIGSVLFHKVVDGATMGTFMKAWAGSNIGSSSSGEEIYPDYRIKSLYPQIESVQRESHMLSAMKRYHKIGKTEMRRFVFGPSAISKLRAQISSSDGRCSRAEAVSALMWKWFITASTAKNSGGSTKYSIVTHGVNMRRRSDPPLPESSFGNFLWTVPASVEISSSGTTDLDLNRLMMKARDSIREVDVDFVARMRGDGGVSGYYDNLEESWKGFPEDGDYLAITSWCNLGIYGVDFGWGRPVWISKFGGGNDNEEFPYVNSLWLMDTREGDGVEAWLTLGDKYMSEFDKETVLSREIKDLARVDPSPMIVG